MGEELLGVVGNHHEQALPSRDFQAENVADAIASLLILCTFRNSLKMQVKVQFSQAFRWGSHLGNKMACDPKNGW